MPDFLIDDDTNPDFYMDPVVDGETMGRGAIPRDYEVQPMGSDGGNGAEMPPIIPKSEWSARIKEMESTKSRLSDIRRNALVVLLELQHWHGGHAGTSCGQYAVCQTFTHCGGCED
jgi:hypothetical protein